MKLLKKIFGGGVYALNVAGFLLALTKHQIDVS
jgi:hypothetical protein